MRKEDGWVPAETVPESEHITVGRGGDGRGAANGRRADGDEGEVGGEGAVPLTL